MLSRALAIVHWGTILKIEIGRLKNLKKKRPSRLRAEGLVGINQLTTSCRKNSTLQGER